MKLKFNEYKYILIELFNGEGYSSPFTVRVNNQAYFEQQLALLRESYNEFKETKVSNIEYTYSFQNSNGLIKLIQTPPDKFTLLELQPDVCEIKILKYYDTKQEALNELQQLITTGDFEQDDVDDYDGEFSFDSHSEEVGYIHYQII